MADAPEAVPAPPAPKRITRTQLVELVTELARCALPADFAAWAQKWGWDLITTLNGLQGDLDKLNLSHKFLGNSANAGAQMGLAIRKLEKKYSDAGKGFIRRPEVEAVTEKLFPVLIMQWVMAEATLVTTGDAEAATYAKTRIEQLFGKQEAAVAQEASAPNVSIPQAKDLVH